MAYLFLKPKDDFDKIMDFDRTYFDYSDEELQKKPLVWLRTYTRYVLHFGLLLYILEINFSKSILLFLVFAMNVLLQMTSFYMPFRRYGPDTTAYTNQAAQFWSGQTDYNKISSMQGPAYYPPGELLHYSVIYKIFLATDQGEYILKMIHIVIHAITAVMASDLAFKYFDREHLKAQMICFALIANEETRELNLACFNDSFLCLYITLCIYFCTVGRPLSSAFMLTLAISIKAGALLIIPACLGIIQYQYGIMKLVPSLVIIVAF